MRNLLRAVLICIALVAMIPATWIAIYAAQRALGYFPGGHFPTIAQYAAEQGDVRLCRRIIGLPWPTVGGPSTADARLSCIHDYASLTKDPNVCELLMPSEYGFSCIGAAEDTERICSVEFGRIVGWGSYLDGTRQEATLAECMSTSGVLSETGQKCCIISKVANVVGYDDCSSLSEEASLYEECLFQLALKTGDMSICDSIPGTGNRIACSLRAKYKSALSTLPPPLNAEDIR